MPIKRNFFVALFLGLSQVFIDPCSAQDNATASAGTAGQDCKSAWIQGIDVGSCNCVSGTSSTCKPCALGQCGQTALSSSSHLNPKACGQGCVDANMDCDSCYIWFDQVCTCVKAGTCKTSWTPTSTNPAWVLLPAGDLISTTQLMPGILELNSDEPWQFGQSQYSRKSQALAINSVFRRTQEQIHVHVCPANTMTQGVLDNLNPANFQKMSQVNGYPWLCRAAAFPIKDVTYDIQAQIKNPMFCKDYIGAAVVDDNKGRTWACVTTDAQGTQAIFCK
ncbi:hypothetical protein N7523_003817 [Penicillium sp. IBT 18751x]|nr:hypothetical protein N7523_003817 [Penicillium sp. IBT 18751x]